MVKKTSTGMQSPQRLSIGELARRSGVKVETIRYYEKIGMMPEPPRSVGGQRIYSPPALKRLRFLRRSRELGFSLKEVGALLSLERRSERSCAEVKALTLEHVNAIRHKIADLRRMERMLVDLADRCDTETEPGCPILDALIGGNIDGA